MNNEKLFHESYSHLAPADLYISRSRMIMNDRVDYEQKKREQLEALGMKDNESRENQLYENVGKEFNLHQNDINNEHHSNNAQVSRYETIYPVSRSSRYSNSSRRGSQNTNFLETNGFKENDDRDLMFLKGEFYRRNSDGTAASNQQMAKPDMEKLKGIQERPCEHLYLETQKVDYQDNNNETKHPLRREGREIYERSAVMIKGIDGHLKKFPDIEDTYSVRIMKNQFPATDMAVDGVVSHHSKALLPKVYSDDTYLFNPKPMTGSNQSHLERNYDTFPVVTRRTARPSLQDLEKSMVLGLFHHEDKSVDEIAEQSYSKTIHDDNNLYEHKSNRKRRSTKRNKNNFLEDETILSVEIGSINLGNSEKTINVNTLDRNQSYKRPNQLSLISNNQDMFKHLEQPQKNIEQNDAQITRNRRGSSSSSDSYCSIESPRESWNRPSTPDSTSSSPIIWNFSHFYLDKKVR